MRRSTVPPVLSRYKLKELTRSTRGAVAYVAVLAIVWATLFSAISSDGRLSWYKVMFYVLIGAALAVVNVRELRRWNPDAEIAAARRPPDARAEITFLRPDEGGRHRHIVDGYQGDLYYDGKYWLATYSFSGGTAEPGETTAAQLTFVRPELHRGRLYPGKEFELREGSRVVARGRITASFEAEEIQRPT